jgi:hypothetical protein
MEGSAIRLAKRRRQNWRPPGDPLTRRKRTPRRVVRAADGGAVAPRRDERGDSSAAGVGLRAPPRRDPDRTPTRPVTEPRKTITRTRPPRPTFPPPIAGPGARCSLARRVANARIACSALDRFVDAAAESPSAPIGSPARPPSARRSAPPSAWATAPTCSPTSGESAD